MFYGVVQKDYGTSLFATGTVGGVTAPNLLYQADFVGNSTLQAFNGTCMYQYGTGTFAADSPVYTATYSDYWSVCMHNDAMIYGNGKGLLQYKTAYNSTGTMMGGINSGSYTSWMVVSFKEHLNLYHTVEAGSENYKRVRWSKSGLLAYASADWSGGTSGFLDLQDMDGALMAAHKVGNGAVAIYGENSIHIQEWVGGGDVYRFTKVITNLGIPARRAVVANDNVHYIATLDNIYEYWGGRDIRPIGDAIKAEYVANISKSNAGVMFLQYVRADDELRVYIPTGTSTMPDTCYICKVKNEYAWYKTTRAYTAAGEFNRQSNITIGDLIGNIGAQNWQFGDYRNQSGAKAYLLADTSGRVVQMDKTLYSISLGGTSTAQSFVWDSKDLSSVSDVDPITKNKMNLSYYMDNETRWQTQKVELMGAGSAYLAYSIDGGNTFIPFVGSPVTLTDTWSMFTLDVDVTNPSYMYRISNSGINEVVHMRYGKVQLVPGSEVG